MHHLRLFLHLVIALSAVSSGFAQHRVSGQEKRADRYLIKKSYEEAGHLYNKIIYKSPQNHRVRLKLARINHACGEYKRAEAHFTVVINKKYLVRSTDYLNYAETLLSVNKPELAAKWAKKYLAINPLDIAAQNIIFTIEHKSNDHNLRQYSHGAQEHQTVEAEISTFKSYPVAGDATLLIIASTESEKRYVLTDQRLIEVKEEQQTTKDQWLEDLLAANYIIISHTVRLKPVYYGFDKFGIEKNHQIELDKLVSLMKKYSYLEVELGAHSDGNGTYRYNQQLSELRANAVLNYLTEQKVEAERLLAIGYGASGPQAYCGHESACNKDHNKNHRRTEFRLIYLDENQVVSNY